MAGEKFREKRARLIPPESEDEGAELSASELFSGAGKQLSFSRLSN